MSKTSLDVIDFLYPLVKDALFNDTEKPNGTLYKNQRLVNSQLEDVVINSLSINREDIQQGVLNVNIYVPNLKISKTGSTDNSQPNMARLKYLAHLLNTYFLGEVWAEDSSYVFNVQQDNIFEDTNNQHYINFRIEFYSPI